MSDCEHLFYGKTMRCVHCNQPYDAAAPIPAATPVDYSREIPIGSPNDPREDLKRPEHGIKPTEPVETDPRKIWDGNWHRIE